MNLAVIYFTKAGRQLGEKLRKLLETAEVSVSSGRKSDGGDLKHWVEENFFTKDGLIFIGASGIAVRACAAFLSSKLTDPAVLVIDEKGRYVIPLLSGHVGGANRLAIHIADILDAQPVLTTGTDVNGLWAVDEWASRHEYTILSPENIKRVSGKLLLGQTVGVQSDYILKDPLPQGIQRSNQADFAVSCHRQKKDLLVIVPKTLTIGVGCRKGIAEIQIETLFLDIFHRYGLLREAVKQIVSIDIKKQEAGLIGFAKKYQIPLVTWSKEKLLSVEGDFLESEFVRSVTGVGNVCERCALSAGGRLIVPKTVKDGVTMAVAVEEIELDFQI